MYKTCWTLIISQHANIYLWCNTPAYFHSNLCINVAFWEMIHNRHNLLSDGPLHLINRDVCLITLLLWNSTSRGHMLYKHSLVLFKSFGITIFAWKSSVAHYKVIMKQRMNRGTTEQWAPTGFYSKYNTCSTFNMLSSLSTVTSLLVSFSFSSIDSPVEQDQSYFIWTYTNDWNTGIRIILNYRELIDNHINKSTDLVTPPLHSSPPPLSSRWCFSALGSLIWD